MNVIGIDVGGHSIKSGIVTSKGSVLNKIIILTEPEKGRQAIVEKIITVAQDLLKKEKGMKAIGVGIPGIIDKKGYITLTPNIPLSKFDLGRVLKSRLPQIKKFAFGNDANNFAVAIQRFGAVKGKRNIVGLTLGTGVGSGLIIDGKVFRNNGAPELGHTTIKFDVPPTRYYKNEGCIEAFIGRRSFPEGPLEVYKMALAGNKQAIKRFEAYGMYLGVAIANFVNIFNPEVVVLGGQMSNAFPFFKATMETEVKKRALFPAKIIKNTLPDAGIVGAGILAF